MTDNIRNSEVNSYNHCFSGKTISFTYCEWVFVALVIQHAMRMRRIVICVLSRSKIFFRLVLPTARFSKKKKFLNTKCVF